MKVVRVLRETHLDLARQDPRITGELSAQAARIPDQAVRRAFLERVPEHAELAARARRRG